MEAVPKIVPTLPIMPGTSWWRVISIGPFGIASTSKPSIATMRGPPYTYVPVSDVEPHATRSDDENAVVPSSPRMSTRTPSSAAIERALTIETRRSVVICRNPERNAFATGSESSAAILPCITSVNAGNAACSESCG